MTLDQAAHDFEEWLHVPPLLQKNDCSRLHKLKEAFPDRVVFCGAQNSQADAETTNLMFTNCHPFVVQHDWAAAFSGSEDYESGEIKLPYPICAFEFRISGRNVIIWTAQEDDCDPPIAALGFVEVRGLWFCREELRSEFADFTWQQIRAIAIALDAGVASHSVIRAPFKLNRKREAQGKALLSDYRVVTLSRRARALPAYEQTATVARKRLHFRRGHWRHYSDFKTWIKWTLVGNPDLGFINHEYRL